MMRAAVGRPGSAAATEPVAIDRALAELAHDGKITSQRVLTAGRPAELWTATRH